MPSESGDLKLLGNFRKLIDLISADAHYKHSNAALIPAALSTANVYGQRATSMVV